MRERGVRLPGRPLGPRRAWALLDLLAEGDAAWLASAARSQLRARLRGLAVLGARADLTTSPPGAIIMKAAATELPGPARHYRDLALLCSVVGDPFDLAGQLTAKDRQRLRKARALADDSHIAWSLMPPEIRSQGQITFSVLTAS